MIGLSIVSGFMGTGTTMMMKAFAAGGMDAIYEDPELFELTRESAATICLNPARADGKLFKCFAGGLTRLAAWKWRIVIMQRDYEEIRRSLIGKFGAEQGTMMSEKNFTGLMEYSMAILNQRRDVEWVGIQYRAVLEDPLGVFELLAGAGWPIDPAAAAAVVDPALCHHRVDTPAQVTA